MPTDPTAPAAQLEAGAYEIIRSRLATHGSDLRARLARLNAERQAVFGAVEPTLLATERVSTAHACTPRDLVAIGGNRFLFGFNVQFGLKTTTAPADVFAAYQYHPENHTFSETSLDFLLQGSFAEDFAYLYKYYREASFLKFRRIGPHLYMAFRAGKTVDDIKCFKWRDTDAGIDYLGNRFDHEYVFPPPVEFEWTRVNRSMHRDGVHPHISIEDRVFVETVGGDLTIKVEDNTATGEGIHAEPVEHRDQKLDDATIFYAIVGNLILLKIQPYQEKAFRYLVFNEKVRSVTRIDSIADSCVLLPGDQGIIFADGYHLQTGETKRFDNGLTGMIFERRIASPNGEDYLYAFHNRVTGVNALMPYHIIEQSVDTPIVCHGYTVFPDGGLIHFRAEAEPQKHHALQIWRTPYMEGEFRAPGRSDSHLNKIGNAAIVRCMAECHEVLNLLGKDDTYADLYVDLAKRAGDICDAYFWIGHAETFDLRAALSEIRGAAQAAIAEFDKVRRLRQSTASDMKRVGDKARKLATAGRNTRPDDILGFVHSLAGLREVRGEVIALRELRYADAAAIEAMENDVIDATGAVSQRCVEFLLRPEALDPYRSQITDQEARIPAVAKVAEADAIDEELSRGGAELEMLIDIVGGLKIADATQSTQIIEDISGIYAILNRVRSALKNRRKDLARAEGVAQFGAQLKLLNQAVVNYLDLCDTPAKCDEYLSKTMVQLEELEGRFAEFDEYVAQLVEKRDEVYNAFEARKLQLVEARNRRTASLAKSADRLLTTIKHRLDGFDSAAGIAGYLAGDLMVEKVRDTIAQLTAMGDPVKADEIQTRLKTLREDAVRQLKDRQELFVDGRDVIQLGNHRFSVNRQELELSIVPKDDTLCLHLAGTNFFEPIADEAFLATREVWSQEVVSEDRTVYRAEYLAWRLLLDLETLDAWLAANDEGKLEAVREFMAPRYREGYTKGVHDRDAVAILSVLGRIHREAGLLRYGPDERALALLWHATWDPASPEKVRLTRQLSAFGQMRRGFPEAAGVQSSYVAELSRGLEAFRRECPGFGEVDATLAAEYLFFESIDPTPFTISPRAAELMEQFRNALTERRLDKTFAAAMTELAADPVARFQVACDWIGGALGGEFQSDPVASEIRPSLIGNRACLLEAAAHLIRGETGQLAVNDVALTAELSGLAGDHPRIDGGRLAFDYHEFTRRLRGFCALTVPRFEAYEAGKVALIESRRAAMRLEEFKPKVMPAFVRNRLLDRVYLPLIGDNLAKQMGTAGADTRTDRMGMLLLISPPGYGKTTLMEYVANRLGLAFMKINGPALGHEVTSLDPADAPNAGAREEIHKLNLALEMGDNIMLYVDDIQHTHPEFLQKFISLCDAQRKIEGVWNGRPRTYDLRGRKVCVVMAGNPYTESGGKFQIPDMLANRADTYNLGDIAGDHSGDFEASYIENAATSNAVLARLVARHPADLMAVMRIAQTGSREGIDLEGSHSLEEMEEYVSAMKKLMRVRDTILRVNREYIRSAAMEDAYRTEPAFRLQGSYRNMNRIAERIVPLMTDAEVEAAIFAHYENEAQTLTKGAEANLLKFRELEGVLTEAESERWEEIKRKFSRNLLMGAQAGENDPVGRVIGTLAGFSEGLGRIEGVLTRAAQHREKPATLADVTVEKLERIIADLRAVPVNVEIKVVPVREGEEAGEEAATAPKRKRVKGKPQGLPVDVESGVDQPTD
ncbi:MAG: DNA repair ATPase [Verrucomicrobiales bacterium]|nr:DNA repair ATPase [Verrucomicrobiales bacterium]